MRTNIEIDDSLMGEAMKAGPFKTKKDAVEAGLRLLARQAAYREIAKWRGRLKWEGDEGSDWTVPAAEAQRIMSVAEPGVPPGPGRPAQPPSRPAGPARKNRARR